MSRVCDVCGKHTVAGNRNARNVKKTSGWYNRAPNKRRQFKPNIQPRRINLGGVVMKVKVCTNCIKTLVKV